MIQQGLGGDLKELQAAYVQDNAGYPVLSNEAVSKEWAKCHAVKHDPVRFDLVIIGTPVWDFNISSPVKAYLKRYHGKFMAVVFFGLLRHLRCVRNEQGAAGDGRYMRA